LRTEISVAKLLSIYVERINLKSNMISENDIINGLKSGQEKAYQYLYKHYYKMLCAVAFELTRDTVGAEIVVSDVIFALWEKRSKLNIHTSLRSYLLTSVRNRCLNYLAQMMRGRELVDSFEYEMQNDPFDNDTPLDQLICTELGAKVDSAIDALPPRTRQIFCMSRFDNLKYDEIACRTNISVNNVKYHLKSALAKLREELKDYLQT